METWKSVVGFRGLYEVSNTGEVRSINRSVHVTGGGYRRVKGRTLSPGMMPFGHLCVSLWNKKQKMKLVHHIVLEAFVGPRPIGAECRHLNGDPADNRLENLKWGTSKENSSDRLRHGTSNRGERNPMRKLTEDEVFQVRILCEHSDLLQREIGEMYGLKQQAVSNIHKRKNWWWL